MGQAIVYCSGCNAQLRDTDFAKGAAFKIEHKITCRKCLPAGFIPPPSDRTPAPKRHGIMTPATQGGQRRNPQVQSRPRCGSAD